jgi:hypothetical protein
VINFPSEANTSLDNWAPTVLFFDSTKEKSRDMTYLMSEDNQDIEIEGHFVEYRPKLNASILLPYLGTQ